MPTRADAIAPIEPPAKFGMARLWRLAFWGMGAAAALAVAVISSHGEVGARRVAFAMTGLGEASAADPAARAFDAEAEVKRLRDEVRTLSRERDRLVTRVAAIEQNLEDVTGSVSRQLEAVKAASGASAAPWPADGAPLSTPPEVIAATVAPGPPPVTGLPLTVATEPDSKAEPAAEPEATGRRAAYGIEVASGPTIEALRVRWMTLRATYPRLFEGLSPLVSATDVAHANRVELRLLAGPFANADAAAHLCAALVPRRIACQPALYEGQRLALR